MPIAVVVLVDVFELLADGAGVVGWVEDIVADGEVGAVSDCGVSVVAPVLVVVGSAVLSEDVVVTSVVVGIVVVGLIPAVAVIVGLSMENLINEVREQQSSPEQQCVSEWLPQRITHSPPPGFSVPVSITTPTNPSTVAIHMIKKRGRGPHTSNTMTLTLRRFPRLIRTRPPNKLQRIAPGPIPPVFRLAQLVRGTQEALRAAGAGGRGEIARPVVGDASVGRVAEYGRAGGRVEENCQ